LVWSDDLTYQRVTAVLLLIYGSLSGIYYCLRVFWCATARMSELKLEQRTNIKFLIKVYQIAIQHNYLLIKFITLAKENKLGSSRKYSRKLVYTLHLPPGKRDHLLDKYEESGVYQLTCLDCHKLYVGQTGCSFRTRSNEHAQDYRHGNHRSNFVKHLLDCRHTLHPMEDSM
jgi:hypothetical protein